MTESRQTAALRAAMKAARPQRIAQDALAVEAVTTRPMLSALAERLEDAHARSILTEGDDLSSDYLNTDDLARAAAVARAAATYGYPRPPLEQLGAQAGHLPASRTSDPATARESGERTRSTPTPVNHLGRLLRGFLSYERTNPRPGGGIDATLTSEELAHRVGLMGSEYAKRCSDLLALGYIRVAKDTNGHDRTRAGDSGRQRLVFELTDDGRRMAASLHI